MSREEGEEKDGGREPEGRRGIWSQRCSATLQTVLYMGQYVLGEQGAQRKGGGERVTAACVVKDG